MDGAAVSSTGEKVKGRRAEEGKKRKESRGWRAESSARLRVVKASFGLQKESVLLYATMLFTLWMEVVKERKRTSSDWSMI